MKNFTKTTFFLIILFYLLISPYKNSHIYFSFAKDFSSKSNLTISSAKLDYVNFDSTHFEEEFLNYFLEIFNQLNQDTISNFKDFNNHNDSLYFELVKGTDILYEVIRNIVLNYVVPISPKDLFLYAIEGITQNLDPYTFFYNTEQDLDDAIAQDSYIGLGVKVSLVDSSLMIVEFSTNESKNTSDLRLGDIILEIDSIKLVPDLDTLRKYTTGQPNTPALIKVYRESINDTLTINTYRREIPLPAIPAEFTFESQKGGILYLKIQKFDSNLPIRFKENLSKFLSSDNNKAGVIVDLRDNPGGLLSSAVNLAEMLLPTGRTIVVLKGQNPYSHNEYKSLSSPLDTTLPLILLVNSGSASSSEVLAGALQDNDRAIIVGEQTFGKGVVQNLISLPYNSYLKITTAKYFSPSGRCIHRIRSNNKTEKQIDNIFHDQNAFQTLNKRQVYETSGITPDVIVTSKWDTELIKELKNHQFFLRFTSYYLQNKVKVNTEIVFDPKTKEMLFNEFVQFLKNKGFVFKSNAEIFLDSAIDHFKREFPSHEKTKELILIRNSIEKGILEICLEKKDLILNELEIEFNRQLLNFEEFSKFILEKDPIFQKAKELILNTALYQKIINPKL